jgi:AhpD family alkylhydroperoxidase
MFDMGDLKRLAKLEELAPRTMAGFKAPDEAALANGAIPKKHKELMAIAGRTQCPCCIDVHRKAAIGADASEVELSETGSYRHGAARRCAALTDGIHLLARERALNASQQASTNPRKGS